MPLQPRNTLVTALRPPHLPIEGGAPCPLSLCNPLLPHLPVPAPKREQPVVARYPHTPLPAAAVGAGAGAGVVGWVGEAQAGLEGLQQQQHPPTPPPTFNPTPPWAAGAAARAAPLTATLPSCLSPPIPLPPCLCPCCAHWPCTMATSSTWEPWEPARRWQRGTGGGACPHCWRPRLWSRASLKSGVPVTTRTTMRRRRREPRQPQLRVACLWRLFASRGDARSSPPRPFWRWSPQRYSAVAGAGQPPRSSSSNSYSSFTTRTVM